MLRAKIRQILRTIEPLQSSVFERLEWARQSLRAQNPCFFAAQAPVGQNQ